MNKNTSKQPLSSKSPVYLLPCRTPRTQCPWGRCRIVLLARMRLLVLSTCHIQRTIQQLEVHCRCPAPKTGPQSRACTMAPFLSASGMHQYTPHPAIPPPDSSATIQYPDILTRSLTSRFHMHPRRVHADTIWTKPQGFSLCFRELHDGKQYRTSRTRDVLRHEVVRAARPRGSSVVWQIVVASCLGTYLGQLRQDCVLYRRYCSHSVEVPSCCFDLSSSCSPSCPRTKVPMAHLQVARPPCRAWSTESMASHIAMTTLSLRQKAHTEYWISITASPDD